MFALASACGGGGETTDDLPDAASGFAIQSSSPEIASNLAPLDDLELTFTEPLAPDSVDAASGKLYVRSRFNREGVAQTWPAEVAWDAAAETLTIAPILALPPQSEVEVRLDGVASATSGDTLTTTAAYTLRNRVARASQSFFEGAAAQTTATKTDGPLADDNDRVVTLYDGPGVDGDWGTADDRIYSTDETVPVDATTAHRYYRAGAGLDGQWETADDVYSVNSNVYTLDANGLRIDEFTANTLGADGLPCTADDTITRRERNDRDGEGRLVKFWDFTGPGGDATWGTSDDNAINLTTYQYDADGRLTRQVTYERGADNQIDTPDDVVFFYKDLAYDARGLFVSDLQYVGMGDDGTWFTGDDEIGYRTAYTYDVDARLTMQTSYNGPGADAVWESADDEVSNYLAYEPGDKSLHRGRTVYFEAGMDGDWFTADDGIFERVGYTYDAGGNVLTAFQASTPGPDDDYFTDDGLVFYRVQY